MAIQEQVYSRRYEGRSLVETHKSMKIDEGAFHVVVYHILAEMAAFGAGGKAERFESLAILTSLKAEVMPGGAGASKEEEEILTGSAGALKEEEEEDDLSGGAGASKMEEL